MTASGGWCTGVYAADLRLLDDHWLDPGPSYESQIAAAVSPDGGLAFWFFAPGNLEVLVEVLDGCAVNDRWWVFAAGLTNVAVEVVVRDTSSGQLHRYPNPLGAPFQPIQDTEAFATCP